MKPSQATVTSKGQITIPVAIRRTLGLRPGTRVTFRVNESDTTIESETSGLRASLEPFPDFFALAGSVSTPSRIKGKSWREVRALARSQHLHQQ